MQQPLMAEQLAGNNPTAILLGSTGSVGLALCTAIAEGQCNEKSKGYGKLVCVVRKKNSAIADIGPKTGFEIVQVVIEMNPDSLAKAVADAAKDHGAQVALSTLGVGAGTANMTAAEHRAVDLELNRLFAEGCKDAGVGTMIFMSAAGADVTANENGSGAAGGARYNRIKGESEEAVKACGIPNTSIFRPSVIEGSQHTPCCIACLFTCLGCCIPASKKMIKISTLARGMGTQGLRSDGHGTFENDQIKKIQPMVDLLDS